MPRRQGTFNSGTFMNNTPTLAKTADDNQTTHAAPPETATRRKRARHSAGNGVKGSKEQNGTNANQKKKPGKMKRKEYEKELKNLQGELVKVQLWAKHTGAKIVVLFEGRDAAGKGGVIKAITDRTSPRSFRIAALHAPATAKKVKCTCSAIWRICPRREKSCSLTAPGTTAPGWKR